jgi:hypothetical protein
MMQITRLGHDPLGASCAIAGPMLLAVGTVMHPSSADPNSRIAAFSEYAADHHWVLSHLTQLAGVTLTVGALTLLGRQLQASRPNRCADLGRTVAVAVLAIAAALQAVDGVALKVAVDAWKKNSTATNLATANAVRDIEIGLASILLLSVGLATILFGAALATKDVNQFKLGYTGVLTGVSILAGGIVTAYQGFSGLSMAITMPANGLLLCWVMALGIIWIRQMLRAHSNYALEAPDTGVRKNH